MSITIYSKGLVHCSVCASNTMTKKEVEIAVNKENPTGIESKWVVSKDKFSDGAKNPNQCEKRADRKHYLLSC